MLGRTGRPHPRQAMACLRLIWLPLLVAVSVGAEDPAAEPLPSMRLRVEWGGGERTVWTGQVRVSEGRLLDPVALDIEADTPGTLRLEGNRLLVRHQTRRAYSGLDVSVQAPHDATVTIELQSADRGSVPEVPQTAPPMQSIEIPLRRFLHGQTKLTLDAKGNNLLVYRLAGDALRVEVDHPHMIFEPGDTLSGQLTVPLLDGLSRDALVQWELRPARARERLNHGELGRLEAGSDGPVPFPLTIQLPEEEGVYALHLSLISQGRIRQVRLYERQIEFVVLAASSPSEAIPASNPAQEIQRLIEEIEPSAKGAGWRAAFESVPRFFAGRTLRADNVELSASKTTLGTFVEMNRRNRSNGDCWVAYRLRIKNPAQPHLVEVDYPEDRQQSLAVSIVEPNPAGRVWPVGLDSGVYTGDPGELRDRVGRHSLLFYPRTAAPLLLLTNLRTDAPAAFGRIRVYELQEAVSLDGATEPDRRGLGDALRKATNQAIQFVGQPMGAGDVSVSGSANSEADVQANPQSPDESVGRDAESAPTQRGPASPPHATANGGLRSSTADATSESLQMPLVNDRVAAGSAVGTTHQRLFGPYMNKPLFPENFGAAEQLEHVSRRSLDDWLTFWQGAQRLVAYLKRHGYNSMILAVLADGSTIYPSALVAPTPRYDMGVFFPDGQDPMRKDVLELLFRIFDREGIVLIPEVQFTAPLPALEHMLAEAPPGTDRLDGVRLIGADGRDWLRRFGSRRGAAPYYNPLDPLVQLNMVRVIGELADRYGQHPSFGGLAVQLSADGYTQFPGLDWGYDDATIARFAADAQIELPQISGRVDRTAQYYRMLTQRSAEAAGPGNVEPRPGRELRKEWLNWRARKLAELYEQFAKRLRSVRGDARLYLTTTHALAGSVAAAAVYSDLQEGKAVEQLLLERGIDRRMTGSTRDIVWLRPSRVGTVEHLRGGALDLDVNTSPELDEVFRSASAPGTLFFHRPYTQRLPSFDDANLPWRDTFMQLIAQLSPAGADNRRRFAHALATLDAQQLFDGGWLIPMGQEQSLAQWIAAYRRLPPVPFVTVEPKDPSRSTQPVVVRRYADRMRTVLYLVNDSPWTVSANVWVKGPADAPLKHSSAEAAVNLLPAAGRFSRLECRLGAYGLCVVEFAQGNLEVADFAVEVPASVQTDLQAEIASLRRRLSEAPIPGTDEAQRFSVALPNPGFEQAGADDASTPEQWTFEAVDRFGRAQRDRDDPREGQWSLRCSSRGMLTSSPFPAPDRPFMGLKVWLRSDRETVWVRLVLLATTSDYERRSRPIQIGRQWGEYMFRVFDLPHGELEQLRARLEISQDANVWVDGVEPVAFPLKDTERLQLGNAVNNADHRLQTGKLSDCRRLLDSYWARFAREQLPDPSAPDQATTVLTRRPQARR